MFKTFITLALLLPAIAWGGNFGITFTGGPGIASSPRETVFGIHSIIKLSYTFKRFEFGSHLDISGGPPLSNGMLGISVFLNRKGPIVDNSYYYYGINADKISFGTQSEASIIGLHGGFVKILNRHWEFVVETGINIGPGTGIETTRTYSSYGAGPGPRDYKKVPVIASYIPFTIGVRCVF